MDSSKVTVGMQVCVNDLPDTIIYTVAEKMGHGVKLTYKLENGETVSGGLIDCCYLKKPTKQQIKNGGLG